MDIIFFSDVRAARQITYPVSSRIVLQLAFILGLFALPLSGGWAQTVLEPASSEFRKLAGQAVSGPTIMGIFSGDRDKSFDIRSLFVCLPKTIKANSDLWLNVVTQDGRLEMTYRYRVPGEQAGQLVQLATPMQKESAEEFSKYKSGQVAQDAYLGPARIKPEQRLVLQSSKTVPKQVLIQVSTGLRYASVSANGKAAECEVLRSNQTTAPSFMRFNRICSIEVHGGAETRMQLLLRAEPKSPGALKQDLNLPMCP